MVFLTLFLRISHISALYLDCDVRTIHTDIHKLTQEGILVPTRGTVREYRDIFRENRLKGSKERI